MLKPGGQVDGDEALEFYAKHTAQIEVKAAGTQRGPVVRASCGFCPVRGWVHSHSSEHQHVGYEF